MRLNMEIIELLSSLDYVIISSVILTLILTGLIKIILRGSKVINQNMDPTQKDILLSRVGRLIAVLTYISMYVVDTIYIKHLIVEINIELLLSIIRDSAVTLIVTKGLYTMIRQMQKKNSVYEKLEVAEVTINELQEEIDEINTNISCKEERQRTTFVLGEKVK